MRWLLLVIPISLMLVVSFVLYNILVLDKGTNTVVVYWGQNATIGLMVAQNVMLGWLYRKSPLNLWLIYTALCVAFLGLLILRVFYPPTLH